MQKYFKLTVVVVLFLFVGVVDAQTINTYMSISPDNNRTVANLIKDRTGVTVNHIHLGYEELEARMKAEAPNFTMDMIIGSSFSSAILAKKSAWSLPYKSEGWKGVSSDFIDLEGSYFNLGNASFVLIGHKQRLQKLGYEFPSSLKSLLDPKWKGEIVMPSPLTAGMGNLVRGAFLSLYGEEKGWKALEVLGKNVAQFTRNGNGATELVCRGEYALALASDEQIRSRIDQGCPIMWRVPEEGTLYQGTYAFIMQGTKNLDACKKVVDFLGSQEMSDVMAGFGAITPRVAVNGLYGKNKPKYISSDVKKLAEKKAKYNEIWKQRIK